jgi:hypothetical protein
VLSPHFLSKAGRITMISLRSDDTLTAKVALTRLFKTVGIACALTLVAASAVRAQDADDQQPEMSFEHKLIDGLLRGIGGQNVESDKGIKYRERSPLVIPSKLDLPPPASTKTPTAANWPKDPDIQARKEAIAANRAPAVDWNEDKLPLMPSELARGPNAKERAAALTDDRPGMDNSNIHLLTPSQLGFKNSMLSGLFGAGKEETAKFVKEPERSELSQPPVGYQTPSSSYAYGAGPMQSKTVTNYNPVENK